MMQRWSWGHLGGSHPVLIILSREDLHSDVFYTKQLLPKSHGCWAWHHAVESSDFSEISWIWLDKNKDFSGRSPKSKAKTSPKVSSLSFSFFQCYPYVIRSHFFMVLSLKNCIFLSLVYTIWRKACKNISIIHCTLKIRSFISSCTKPFLWTLLFLWRRVVFDFSRT